jgi:magnesium chelatase family protein
MTSAKNHTVEFQGVNVIPIEVQAHLSNSFAKFKVVGLGDKTVSEAKERVRAAIASIGIGIPAQRITINLSPADILKEGSHYDLAITLALLEAMNIINKGYFLNHIICGELSLDANILPISGILPTALYCSENKKTLLCSDKNSNEALWANKNLDILSTDKLINIIKHSKQVITITRPQYKPPKYRSRKDKVNFNEINGHKFAKRALEIAAAGRHNLLMIGPAGSGKSMLAKAFPSIFPNLSPAEILENSIISSISKSSGNETMQYEIPFRAPHHSASHIAISGGGKKAQPGEVSLANNGILFLDELPEFNKTTLETLRQPMEDGEITIARADNHITYPAKFILIAAMNPCRCGNLNEDSGKCYRAPRCGAEYQSRISGPLMDRFDMIINVTHQQNLWNLQHSNKENESSNDILTRIGHSYMIADKRYKLEDIKYNSQLSGNLLNKYAKLNKESQDILARIYKKKKLSHRSINKIIKLARTIADLQNREEIKTSDILEAVSYKT